MRVLCSVTGSPSHARAMLPLARALADAGHTVMVAAPRSLLPVFDDEPVTAVDAIPDMIDQVQAGIEDRLKDMMAAGGSMLDSSDEMITMMFVGPQVTANFHILLPIAREFGPDLVLRDGGEFAAGLVAETLGVPYLTVPSGAANALNPHRVIDTLNDRRGEVGLVATPDPWSMYPNGRVDCMPAAFSFSAHPAPKTYTYRQPAAVESSERLPEWYVDLPADRPLVMAAVGTALPMMSERLASAGIELPSAAMPRPEKKLAAIRDALVELDFAGLVATGGIAVPAGAESDQVRLVDRFPQPLLLQCAQLFITHGGYNSIREAVGAGVPMIVMPQFGDQPANADRVEELGLGVRLDDDSPEAIAAACRRVLDDATITARVRRAQRAMLALPSLQDAVTDLEQIVAEAQD